MPDGTVIRGVPEGVTQSEVMRRYQLSQPQTQLAASAPEPPPTNAGPMSWGEAGKRYMQAGIPGVLYGAATAEPSEASEHSLASLKGMKEAITGIPGMVGSLGSAFWQNLKGVYGTNPADIDKGVEQTGQLVKGAIHGISAPVTVPARGAAALLAPEKFEAPSREESLEAAGAAGTNLGGLLLGEGGGKLMSKVSKYTREAPIRKGYTTLDPATLKPVPPEPPILVKHGLPAPEIPKGKLPTYKLQTSKIADGLGLLDDVEGTQMKNAIAEVYPDLKYAQANAEGVRGPVNTPAKLRAVLDWNGERLWNTILEPELKQSGKMRNLATLSEDVQAQLPEHVKQFYGEMVQAKLDPIQKVIDRYKKPGEAIPQVDPMMIHGLVKAIRNELDLAATPMEQGIQRQLPKGEILFELNKVLRDKLYEHVETTRGVDLRPVARKYGMNATIKGEAADLTTPKGFFETLFSSYTFPTPRAVAARIGETAGKQLISRMKSLKKGFDFKMTPEEELLVTRPNMPKSRPRASIAGPPQQLGPTYNYGIEEGPLAPEPAPGPTARFINWSGRTPSGENVWPAPTKPGVQQSIAENALPDSSGQPGKPGEFFPGKQGKQWETDPKTGEPIRRDYRKQEQLFSIKQTPPPRWKPTEHVTSTLQDLQAMKSEIVDYLANGNPSATARRDYIADVRALQSEITRRQQARKAGPQQP